MPAMALLLSPVQMRTRQETRGNACSMLLITSRLFFFVPLLLLILSDVVSSRYMKVNIYGRPFHAPGVLRDNSGENTGQTRVSPSESRARLSSARSSYSDPFSSPIWDTIELEDQLASSSSFEPSRVNVGEPSIPHQRASPSTDPQSRRRSSSSITKSQRKPSAKANRRNQDNKQPDTGSSTRIKVAVRADPPLTSPRQSKKSNEPQVHNSRANSDKSPVQQSSPASSDPTPAISRPKPKNDPSSRYKSGHNKDEIAAVQFLKSHDRVAAEQCYKAVLAEWNYATNINTENKEKLLQQSLEYAEFQKEAWFNATSFAWKSFRDPLIKRWFKTLSILGKSALPTEKLREHNELSSEMENVYSTGKVCPYKREIPKNANGPNDGDASSCNLTLEPDLTRILSKSRDFNELEHVWTAWRDSTGKPIRDKFIRFVQLSNEAARLNGFNDSSEVWREQYESNDFQENLEHLWEQIRPLYQYLHAYVRRKLIHIYGEDRIKPNGPIPAHLLGNMWAQSWRNLQNDLLPYPDKPSIDVTPVMVKKNLTALDMFKISEEFFTSIGMKPLPDSFWTNSIIERPTDGRELVCHASAWDFCNGKDFRIKQCTDITMRDLITTHHEMGHIQYFIQYAHQPYVFREGANPGFHEAVGDVLALSVSTPSHLKQIGLLEEIVDDEEGDLNYLMALALDKIAFLPSGYLMDLWRWGVFSGEIGSDELNQKWWEYRLKYQGVCPPVRRTEEDFDPGSKYHIAANVPYIRYFVSFVIQFQFHKSLCEAAGQTGPLHKCDIYKSQEAGQLLGQVLELGSSEPWQETMKIMTGSMTDKMDASAILEYFDPLVKWLKNNLEDEHIGWDSDDPMLCPGA